MDQEEAINFLIDALRWDSKNKWALMMMGNIFAKYKDDTETALKYYNQAIVDNVQDHISLTNIDFLFIVVVSANAQLIELYCQLA